jgi:predicted DNA-binding protein with PD1-like motif
LPKTPKMEQGTQKKYQPGKHVVGPLPEQKDLIDAIEMVCRQNAIVRATFSVSGSVSSAMIGVFDQVQEVHVTHLENNATELLFCQGTFAATGGKPCVRAKVILADQQGQLTGGHLFSDTIIHDAEIDLQELL